MEHGLVVQFFLPFPYSPK